MNKFIERLYAISPLSMQNLFCSAYGWKLYRERYSQPWKMNYDYLMETQFAPAETINKIQVVAFKKILSHAIEYVPYYRDILRITKSDFTSFDSLDMLTELPVTEKSHFRETPETFVSTYYDRDKLIKIDTSGTTGTPLTIYVSPNGRKFNYAFFARAKNWAGINNFERSITLAGRTIVPAHQENPPFWRKNIAFNNTLFSSYHISEKNIKFYVDKIREINPVFIDSYPSSIANISDYMIKNGITDIKVKSIITSSETLLQHHREKIEKAFACKVFDQYGSAEQAVFICQCEKGKYHLNPEYGYLEILDKNNEPVKFGELGEFVVTGFTNDAMPFIRYRIGDMGIMTDEKCSCGRNFPVIEMIAGRNDDLLITPDGKYIGRLDPIFKGMSNSIKETQIVQEKVDLIRILIVRTDKYKEEDGKHLVEELEKRMGSSITYKIEYVDEIARTSSGKFRAVICRVSK